MIRTEWLNMSVRSMDEFFRHRCNCSLTSMLRDIQDTAAEASGRGHTSRAYLLFMLGRRAQVGCPATNPTLKSKSSVHRVGRKQRAA